MLCIIILVVTQISMSVSCRSTTVSKSVPTEMAPLRAPVAMVID